MSDIEIDFELRNPIIALEKIINVYGEYLKVCEQEQTRRCQIEAYRQISIAEIEAKRQMFIAFLERSFDERYKNFQILFEKLDNALDSHDNQQAASVLHAIVEIAKSSPFKDLADLSNVKASLQDPNYVWEI